jgi:hypothetical protein
MGLPNNDPRNYGWNKGTAPAMLHQLLAARGGRDLRIWTKGGVRVLMNLEPYLPGGALGLHMSISLAAGHRNPSWEQQKDAVYTLAGHQRFMVQVLPPLSRFGTLPDSNVFHWFEVPEGFSTVLEGMGDFL